MIALVSGVARRAHREAGGAVVSECPSAGAAPGAGTNSQLTHIEHSADAAVIVIVSGAKLSTPIISTVSFVLLTCKSGIQHGLPARIATRDGTPTAAHSAVASSSFAGTMRASHETPMRLP